MDIAIVILNWNGKDLLEQFLPSVVQFSDQASIYVADNASEDDSVSFVKLRFPNVHIIRNNTNGGFAKGYNDALKKVNADILCLLNNDVEVTQQWLKPIIETFKREPDIAIIQPKILDHKQKDHFEYAGAAGGFIDKYGFPYCRGRIFSTIEKDQGQYNDSSSIFWSSGACFFIRKAIFDELNGFDESFFAHMEEIDLCWRLQRMAYRIRFVPSSIVYHVGGATLQRGNPFKTYLNFRNNLLLLYKNLPARKRGKILFIRMILDGISALRFLLQGAFKDFWAVLRAHFAFYGMKSSYRGIKNLNKYKENSVIACGIYPGSIVQDFFLKNRKKFSDLDQSFLARNKEQH